MITLIIVSLVVFTTFMILLSLIWSDSHPGDILYVFLMFVALYLLGFEGVVQHNPVKTTVENVANYHMARFDNYALVSTSPIETITLTDTNVINKFEKTKELY